MEKKIKIASILLYIICTLFLLLAALLAVGVVLRGALLPPMEELIGMTTQELNNFNPKVFKFFLRPLSMVAALLFTLSISIFMLTKGPFKKQDPWARNVIFTMLAIYLALAEIIALSTFPVGPWPVFSLCIILAIISFIISKPT